MSEVDEKLKDLLYISHDLTNIEEKLKKLLYCCDGLHDDYINRNFGDANRWVRHIADAYGKYDDALDEKEEE